MSRLFALAIGDRPRASSRLRVWDHLDDLDVRGYRVESDAVVPMHLVRDRKRLALRLLAQWPMWVGQFARARVVYLQETLILWLPVMLAAAMGGKTVIFDFSDPVDTIGTGLKRRLRGWGFRHMVANATHVIVENRYYQRSLDRGDIHHFYGPVDVTRYQAAAATVRHAKDAPLRIGWTGSPGTLHFIAPLFPILDRLAERHRIELTLIGIAQAPFAFRTLPVTCLRWDEATEFAEIPRFDLGLHRLDDSEHARKRGAGKLFIYMAAGVPFITDAFGIGADLMAESGTGFAVEDGAWEPALEAAVLDATTRADYATRGVDFARARLSYEAFREMLAGLMPPGRPS